MNPSSVYTGSRGRNDSFTSRSTFTSPVSHSTVKHQTPVKNLSQTNYGFNARPVNPINVAHQVPGPQYHAPVHSPVLPKVNVHQTVPVQSHRYTPQPSFFSSWNPFFRAPPVVNPPLVVVDGGGHPTRVWTHRPASLLASAISVGILAAALFTFGVIAVDPILLILGSILAIASGAGIIRAMNK